MLLAGISMKLRTLCKSPSFVLVSPFSHPTQAIADWSRLQWWIHFYFQWLVQEWPYDQRDKRGSLMIEMCGAGWEGRKASSKTLPGSQKQSRGRSPCSVSWGCGAWIYCGHFVDVRERIAIILLLLLAYFAWGERHTVIFFLLFCLYKTADSDRIVFLLLG